MYFIHRKYEGCFNLNFDIRLHILAPFLKFRRTCHLWVSSVVLKEVLVFRVENLENNLVGSKTCVNNSCNNLCLLFYIDEMFGLVFQWSCFITKTLKPNINILQSFEFLTSANIDLTNNLLNHKRLLKSRNLHYCKYMTCYINIFFLDDERLGNIKYLVIPYKNS